jgi:putative peptide zinc metalloprotease protein
MSAMIPPPAVLKDRRRAAPDPPPPPRLLEDTELIGQVAGSGLREPPYLVRRRDGQVVQLSRLLYTIASHIDGSALAEIAERAGGELNVRISPEQVAYVAEQKLAPLGLIAPRDGSAPKLERVNPLMGLRFRTGVLPERAVNALAGWLRPLFVAPVVGVALAALVACDVWLGTSHGIGAGLKAVLKSPVLGLVLIGLMILSLVFHEFGHAAACRYGGARPGRIGVGIYLVWPAFYTDVTDSYRLNKRGRLRTDLGGVYFNVLFALAAAGAYFATGYEPLLVVVVTQQLLLLDQFMPWMRLDGYHIVSDLIGVSDLFARIKPIMSSLVPRREPHPRVTELKPWARAAVTIWVLTTVTVLGTLLVAIIIYGPGYAGGAWKSLLVQAKGVAHGVEIGSVVAVLTDAVGALMLILPLVGLTLTYLLMCRRVGTSLAQRRARLDLTLAPAHKDQSLQPLRPVVLGKGGWGPVKPGARQDRHDTASSPAQAHGPARPRALQAHRARPAASHRARAVGT